MNPLVSLDGTVGWVILSLPLASLLITGLAAFLIARRRGETKIEFDLREKSAVVFVSPEDAAALRERDIEYQRIPDDGKASDGSADAHVAPASAIAEAELAGDLERLADLHLALGVRERELGNSEKAAELLRKSIVLAKEAGQAILHAKGRLELGDLAQEAGDLSTACEHWQMARALFEEMDFAPERAEAEARMHSNGCPTDWVLTDF